MLPSVILHMGVSVDGRIDYGLADEGPYYGLIGHFNAGADLSGSSTILKAQFPDDPQQVFPDLYAAWANRPDRPLLVVVDSRGQVKNWAVIKRQPFWSGFVALCSAQTPAAHLEYLREQGVEIIQAGETQVDLRRALETLNERFGARVVRVDSGGILNGVLLRAGLVDEVSLILYPALVGGTSPSSLFVAPDLTGPEGVIPVELAHCETLEGKYVWLRYKIRR